MNHACQRVEHGFRQRRNLGRRVDSRIDTIADNLGEQVGDDGFIIVAALHVLLCRHQDHFEYVGIVV